VLPDAGEEFLPPVRHLAVNHLSGLVIPFWKNAVQVVMGAFDPAGLLVGPDKTPPDVDPELLAEPLHEFEHGLERRVLFRSDDDVAGGVFLSARQSIIPHVVQVALLPLDVDDLLVFIAAGDMVLDAWGPVPCPEAEGFQDHSHTLRSIASMTSATSVWMSSARLLR
jgi:hypothetical protein